MKDVAEHAGVSVMTVSLVLRGSGPSERISPDTRRRVLDAARDLRYQPNARGRALRSGITNIIGLYTGYGYVNVRMPFFTEIVSGLQEGCEQVKKDLLLHGVFRGSTPDAIFTELADGRIDGLVVNMPPENPLATRLAGSVLPAVAVADALPRIPSVVADETEGARLLVECLVQRGHRRVVYLGSRARPVSATRRYQAFQQFADASGLQVEEDGQGRDHRDIAGFLAREPAQRPTAAVCWSATTAFDLLATCRDQRIRVPEDLAIVSYDGCSTLLDGIWALTAVHAPWAEIARTAVLHLDALLKGGSVPDETVLPVTFVSGNTA